VTDRATDLAATDRARTTLLVVGLTTIVAVVVVWAVGIGGDFPLSDDWSYAYTLRGLCEDGVVRFLPWTGASVLFQAYYGALLCKLFGFSFTVSRTSTLVLAWIGALVFHQWLTMLRARRRVAALALATFALGPLYVNLSFTFMTDVPFAVLAIGAGTAYVAGLQRESRAWLVVAAIVSSAALLVRQHGVFLPAAAALAVLLDTHEPWSRRLGDAVAAVAIPAVVTIVYLVWLFGLHGAPSGTQDKVREAAGSDLTTLANIAFRAVEYLGLLLAPFGLPSLRQRLRERPVPPLAFLAVLSALVLFLYAREGALMPYLTNVLYDFGLGATSLRDTQFLGLPPVVRLGIVFRVALTIVSTASAAGLLAAWWDAARVVRRPESRFVVIAFALLLAGSFLHAGFYFDRYLLPILPFAIATTILGNPKMDLGIPSIALAGVLALYAIAGTHDYMAWNQARYQALANLERTGASPREIDGGFEYNAWHLAAELGTWPTKEEARPGKPDDAKSWWWVVDDRYTLVFRPLPGYSISARVPYHRWLPPGTDAIYVVERLPETVQ